MAIVFKLLWINRISVTPPTAITAVTAQQHMSQREREREREREERIRKKEEKWKKN